MTKKLDDMTGFELSEEMTRLCIVEAAARSLNQASAGILKLALAAGVLVSIVIAVILV